METENKIVEEYVSKVLELKVYSKPEIIELGSLQKTTLDSSIIGTGDSGSVGPYAPFE